MRQRYATYMGCGRKSRAFDDKCKSYKAVGLRPRTERSKREKVRGVVKQGAKRRRRGTALATSSTGGLRGLSSENVKPGDEDIGDG